jgi:hypothetical protein
MYAPDAPVATVDSFFAEIALSDAPTVTVSQTLQPASEVAGI